MKTAAILAIAFFLTTAYGQTNDYKILLDSAKALFKSREELSREELDKFDYFKIASILEKAVALNPNSTEARYFLGYAYSRANSKDGRGMINMDLNLALKCSEQFEAINKISPKYNGKNIILDPYSKLTAEWGSLAMSYWHNNKADSSVWAFNQGKKRGGFSKFTTRLNKKVLDACPPNSILISSGDIFTISLWYLQIAKNYRKDVAVIDASLLNTTWYPTYLSKNKIVAFDLPKETIDTIQHIQWADSTVTIENFSWTLKPSYYNMYLLRGDRLFLSLLRENKFKRDLYFTIGFVEDYKLSLGQYLSHYVVAQKLTVNKKEAQSFRDYKKSIKRVLKLSKHLNLNSTDERELFENFRYNLLNHVGKLLTNQNKKEARKLMNILDKNANKKAFPFLNEEVQKHADYLRENL